MHVNKIFSTDVDLGNDESGTPLLQMMGYLLIKRLKNEEPKQLDISIIQYFMEKGAILSRVLTAGMFENSTALELSFVLGRLDVAKLLVEANMDPIFGGDPYSKPLFTEYVEFGSVNFIKWLLFYHLKSTKKIQDFVDRLFYPDVFQITNKQALKKGKNSVHSFLLSGHKETIRYLLSRKYDLVHESDTSNKTALHLASEKGDHETVRILLEL